MDRPILCLLGATATGKSALAVTLARGLADRGVPAEIVNADSMLVYRGMDIGTAKPTLAERQGIVHHLIDIMDVTETASVAVFQRLARQAIADIRSRGAWPILVGGSALYLHAIVDRFEFPPTDPVIRSRLQREAEDQGVAALYDRLCRQCPQAARTIGPADSRRIIRALEAIAIQGHFTPALPQWDYAFDEVVQLGLRLDRDQIDARIGDRARGMWAAGLVDEVKGLIGRGLRQGPTASRAIGYRQALAYIDGELTWDQAIDSQIVRTRQFSRKQFGWWRRDPRIIWVDAADVPVDRILDSLI